MRSKRAHPPLAADDGSIAGETTSSLITAAAATAAKLQVQDAGGSEGRP